MKYASKVKKINNNRKIYLSTTALLFIIMSPQFAKAQSAIIMLPNPSGAPSNSQTQAKAISADGTIVAGGNTDSSVSIIWRNGTAEAIDTSASLNGFRFESISGDGLTLVGRDRNRIPSYWTAAEGLVSFQNPTSTQKASGFVKVDNNGTYFAVTSGSIPNANSPFNAWRWSRSGGYENLGNFGGVGTNWDMFTEAISGDGQKIAVTGLNTEVFAPNDGFHTVAGYWTPTSGLVRLPDLSSSPVNGTELTYSRPWGISRDGNVIVGQSRGSDGLVQAAYWRGNNVFGLGFLQGANLPTDRDAFATGSTRALAANLDGSIIVGKSMGTILNQNDTAWRWTATSGMQDLNIFAQNAGINLNGYKLTEAVGLSDNGQFITGNAFNSALNLSSGYLLQIAQITNSRLIVNMRLSGVTLSAIINQTFNTQVDATLNGTNVFTRTFNDAINSTTGTNALNDANLALAGTNGLRRINIGAPVLVSNNTTVLGTSNNTIDVLTGTNTTNATVNTFGPATVATGDLGVCATAASNGQNPTGCSLTGTIVNIDAGVLNSNIFTNTINSITPTTTPTINQLVTAKWKIEATAGNQFGTVHALVGPASFGQSSRFISQLLSLDNISNNSGNSQQALNLNAKNTDENGLSFFSSYYSNETKIDADIKNAIAQTKGNSNGIILGLQKTISPNSWIGAAMDYGTSDYKVRDALYPETLKLTQTQLAIFTGWQNGKLSLNGASSFGFGDVKTQITSSNGISSSSRDANILAMGIGLNYSLIENSALNIDLTSGYQQNWAKLDNFKETGGTSPLIGFEKNLKSGKFYGGFEATSKIKLGNNIVSAMLYAKAVNYNGDYKGIADVKFASNPNGIMMQAIGPEIDNWATQIGVSFESKLNENTKFWAGYDAEFNKQSNSNHAKIGLKLSW